MRDDNVAYSPEEALSAIGFGNFQALILVYAGLGWIAEAMEMMILSFMGRAVQSEWGVSPGEESLITTVMFFGMLFGAYFWGLISDDYGRRKGLLGTTIVVAVAALCSAFAPNYKLFMMSRCLVGFGVGGGHTFASWFLEFVPTPNRGFWVLVLTGFWTFGGIAEALFAWIIMPRLGWRWLMSLTCLPSLFVLLLYWFIPESPRYLATKGRIEEAQKILQKAAFINRTKLPVGVLICDRGINIEENFPSLDTPLLPSARERHRYCETCLSSIFALFSSKFRRTTILVWLLYFANIFLYYGVVLLTSQLSSGQNTCDSTTNLMKKANDSRFYRDVLITSLAELPGLILAAAIVDRIGRKLSMEIMTILGFILLLPLAVNQNEIVTTGLLFCSRMFVTATFDVLVLYAREVYPTSVRSSGVGTATSIGRIGGMICPLVAVELVSNCHQTAAIVLFEAVTVLLGSCILFLPFEPSGKGLSDTFPSADEE